jgi:tRNA (cmo5U34)-methyltransferase
MNSDKIFKEKFKKSYDFTFDEKVTNVFDDMVVRSVPFYLEIQRMIAELTRDYAQANSNVYDLGCSTGTTLLNLNEYVDDSVCFYGIDSSEQMLEKCRNNLNQAGVTRTVNLELGNLNKPLEIENASVVILCLTLQFVRPLKRVPLLQSLYNQLNPGGIVILVEKVLGESNEFNRQFIKYYYDFKRRNNYDEMEIAQKREALENVLIPYKLMENIEMLGEIGFNSIETFFKWYNFAGLVAQK